MFIATDRLWRLRFKIGDEYHARFWGQAIQFLGLSRLLGENRRIRLETDRPAGRSGEPIGVYADVLDESYQPLQGPAHVVYVERLDGGGESEPLKLQPVPNIAGLYQGSYVPAHAGRYRLSAGAEDPNAANTVEFEITAASGEQRDTALREDLLRKMAEASGGRYFCRPYRNSSAARRVPRRSAKRSNCGTCGWCLYFSWPWSESSGPCAERTIWRESDDRRAEQDNCPRRRP